MIHSMHVVYSMHVVHSMHTCGNPAVAWPYTGIYSNEVMNCSDMVQHVGTEVSGKYSDTSTTAAAAAVLEMYLGITVHMQFDRGRTADQDEMCLRSSNMIHDVWGSSTHGAVYDIAASIRWPWKKTAQWSSSTYRGQDKLEMPYIDFCIEY